MKQCKSCVFYNAELDEFRQSYVDIATDNHEWHFCPMYDSYIPFDIIDDKKTCEFHTPTPPAK
jgi:hypothetical protein